MKGFYLGFLGKEGIIAKNPVYWLKIALLSVAGILLLVIGGTGGGRSTSDTVVTGGGNVSPPVSKPSAIKEEEKFLAERLKVVLQDIAGVGEVEVAVRLAGTTRAAFAVNTTAGRRVTEEKDRSGIRRLTTEDNSNGQVVVVVREGQREEPVVEREEAPRILGVLVVADGAADPPVKAEIFRAVQVALGVEAHRVLVVPRRAGAGIGLSSGAEGVR